MADERDPHKIWCMKDDKEIPIDQVYLYGCYSMKSKGSCPESRMGFDCKYVQKPKPKEIKTALIRR